jgi:hypothetical protein
MPPLKKAGDTSDWWEHQLAKLQANGWITYTLAIDGAPTVRGYTPTVLLPGTPNTQANRRKLNRPFWMKFTLPPATPSTGTWTGTLRVTAVSSLNPWATGVAPPFTIVTNADGSEYADIPETAWRYANDGHYLADFETNPIRNTELDAAMNSPTATATNTYTGLWQMDSAFPDDWTQGNMNMTALYNAMVDLFARLNV